MLHSFYPVLLVRDLARCTTFYTASLGFEITFESDWYVSLKREGAQGTYQLALLDDQHATIPEGFRNPSRGIILNLEVESADALYEELIRRQNLPVLLELRDEAWGQRHFMTSDPAGTLIDVIQLIEPSAEFLAQYKQGPQ